MTVKEWREKAKETLEAVSEGDSPGAVMNYLTSATIELALSIIGEDEPLGEISIDRYDSVTDTVRTSLGDAAVRNELRKQLRQSLKEL